MNTQNAEYPITGQCYCGETRIQSTENPVAVAYCHCSDCKRITGAPVAAYAAFNRAAITFSPDEGRAISINAGAVRTFCETCGSPVSGRYDYLPGTVYVAVGLLDQADVCKPQVHAYTENKLPWLAINDDLECFLGSARSRLNQ